MKQLLVMIGTLLLWILILLPSDSHAQEDELVLPHPNDIIADGVDVVAQSAVTHYGSKTIYYFYDNEWRSIPFPDDITPSTSGIAYGRSLIIMEGISLFWEIDPEQGELIPFTPHCAETAGQSYYINIDLGTYIPLPKWVPYTDTESETTFLCNPLTGEIGLAIPDHLEWLYAHWADLYGGSISPSGEWIVLYDPPEDYSYLKPLYSFNTITGEIIELGTPILEGNSYITGWFFDTEFMIRSGDTGWATQYVYVGRVDTPNSIDLAGESFRDYPDFYANPPRIESISDSYYATEYVFNKPIVPPCGRHIYDFETNTSNSYYTGSICTIGIIIPNGNGDRLHITTEPTMGSSLVRFNASTGIRTILFTGEVEEIHAISPDGRYVLMILENTGRTDFSPNAGYDTPPPHDLSTAIVLDITTHEMVYEITDLQREEESTPAFLWLDENQLLIDFRERNGRLIDVDNGQFSEQELNGTIEIVGSDQNWLLLQHGDGSIWHYDRLSANETQLFKSIDPAIHTLRYEEAEEGQLLVSLFRYTDDEEHDYIFDITWLINLP